MARTFINDSPTLLLTTGGTGLAVQKLPFMHTTARFGVDVALEIERVGLSEGGPVFPISPGNMNASDLIREFLAISDDELPYDFPDLLRGQFKLCGALIPYLKLRFGHTDTTLSTGLAQMPVLGSLAALYQIILNTSALKDVYRDHVEEPLWKATQGAPTSLNIISVGSNSGGTGGGARGLIEALTLDSAANQFGEEILRNVTRVSPDPLSTFSGLGAFVKDNALIGLVRDIEWMLRSGGSYLTRRLVFYTQNSYERDSQTREGEQAQLIQVLLDKAYRNWNATVSSNKEAASALARAQVIIPHYFFNVIDTTVALADVARSLQVELGADGRKIPAKTVAITATSDDGSGFNLKVIGRTLEGQTQPGSTFLDTTLRRNFNVIVAIPDVQQFGRRLLDTQDLGQVLNWLKEYHALKKGLLALRDEVSEEVHPDADGKDRFDPLEKVRKLYYEWFETSDEPVKKGGGIFSFLTGNDEDSDQRTRKEVLADFNNAVESYWEYLKWVEIRRAKLEGIDNALQALEAFISGHKALESLEKVRARLSQVALSAVVPEDLIEIHALTDKREGHSDQTFYEALLASVEDSVAFDKVLSEMIKWPTELGYRWMLKIDDFSPDTVVARLFEPKIVSPLWGGMTQRKVISVAYFPGLPQETLKALQEAAGDQFVIIGGVARASMMSVVRLDISWVDDMDELVTPAMRNGIKMALRHPEVWLRLPAYDRVTQETLDYVNAALRLKGDKKLVLPEVLSNILSSDTEVSES